MKVLHDNAIKCALALFAAAGLTACSSSDDVADDTPVNPSYDGNSVKTQFAINIGSLNKSSRMTGTNTQQDGSNFLGMQSIYLLPLTGDEPTAATPFTSNVSLEEISTGIASLEDNHRKIYTNVSIPVGTKNFLLYAKGPSGAWRTDDAFAKGAIDEFNISTSSKPEDIVFSSVKIANGDFKTELAARVAYLNAIKDVSGWSSTSDPSLRQAYNTFTADASALAVSSSALTQWMQNLYSIAATKKDDASVGAIATAIMNAVKGSYFTDDGTGTLTIASEKANFPASLHLPDGVAIVKCTSKTFAATPTIGDAAATNVDVTSLIYPLPITYRCNTLAKATNADINTWPASTTEWATYNWNANGWDNDVRVTSRTIALANPINYGVALLETTVKCNAPTLQDNDQENNVYVNVPAGGFTVTGLLVGGQPVSVDWNFISDAAVSTHDQTVYDRRIPTGMSATYAGGTAVPNYTLLFDSYTSEAHQAKIRVAIELKNNSGQEFTGVDGVVAKDEKFYLVAELDPESTGAGSIDWANVSDDLRFPKKSATRVFIQDFKTKASFTINSLKNAYVTIPDLRSTTLKLGLSVDLTWQTGLSFEVPIE